jgi:hypothetical protein
LIAQEILAGARDEADYRAYREDWVAPFEDLRRIITPGHTTWTRAALIVARLDRYAAANANSVPVVGPAERS